jgi:hypothetical protein
VKRRKYVDFLDWYGDCVGVDEMAHQFGFADYNEMSEWQARKLGFDSFADLERWADEEWDEDDEE